MNNLLVKIIISALANEPDLKHGEVYALDLSEAGAEYADELKAADMMNAIDRTMNRNDFPDVFQKKVKDVYPKLDKSSITKLKRFI